MSELERLCHGDGGHPGHGLRRATTLPRIQEEYRRGPDNARAVSAGLQHTGGLITAATAIMAGVFVSFALADLVVIKAICIGMGVAVVVDATLVRMSRTL